MENREQEYLLALADLEDILEKKTKIYSRLLTDPALAKMMEECSLRHEKRKEKLVAFVCGKTEKKKNGQGMSKTNEEETEE